MIVYMKDWFFEKKKKEYSYISIFNNGSEVADETEKAYKLCVEYETVDGERSGFTNIWCPKSCALSEEEHKKETMEEAEMFWNHPTDKEKENVQEFSVVECGFNEDEEIDFYGITKVIKSYK